MWMHIVFDRMTVIHHYAAVKMKIILIFINQINIKSQLIPSIPVKKPHSLTLRLCVAAATSPATRGYAADKPLTITYSAQSPWQ
jgi:hypothetical protein